MGDPRVELARALRDARERTLELVRDLEGERLFGPQLEIVNPPLWEIGHVAWFQEKWILRGLAGRPPLLANGDALYDSAAIAHDTRWDLPLPSREETLANMRRLLDDVLERLERVEPNADELYFHRLVLYHEDMHDEALTYTRQTHGWPCPQCEPAPEQPGGPAPGDVEVPGATVVLGAREGEAPFVFDNEKWAHEVELEPFALARAPVTQSEFAAFVEDHGYARRELWSEAGWRWREEHGVEQPVYWRRDGSEWQRRQFDRWVPLEPHRPVVHVCWFEAQAWCRWAERRLPTEAEWEHASTCGAAERTAPLEGHLDGRVLECCDVGAPSPGDTPLGLRQMCGNVWEWTATDFGPYPGFVRDPYEEYSEPWFGTHKVHRGGSFATRARTLRPTFRNWGLPHRRDLFTGFRTCPVR